jgi:Domain of unknown function (DUF4150)
MGVVTHTIQGEASFMAWSFDVKVQGANVDRHFDIMLHNEQSNPSNTPPAPYIARATVPPTSTGVSSPHTTLVTVLKAPRRTT